MLINNAGGINNEPTSWQLSTLHLHWKCGYVDPTPLTCMHYSRRARVQSFSTHTQTQSPFICSCHWIITAARLTYLAVAREHNMCYYLPAVWKWGIPLFTQYILETLFSRQTERPSFCFKLEVMPFLFLNKSRRSMRDYSYGLGLMPV